VTPSGDPGEATERTGPSRIADAWLELSVETDGEAVEAVSEILTRVAPGGTSIEAGFEIVDEGLATRTDPMRPVVVRAYLPLRVGSTRSVAAVAEVDAALGHLRAFNLRPIGALETRTVHESDWAAAWKEHFPVLRAGRRIVIRPTWRRHRRRPGDVVIALDPGMAFGTGLHPTTRLCLLGLETLAERGGLAGRAVLDVGCGSGILAIAAVRLGAATALGLDVDPIAIEATTANARRNGLARRVRGRLGGLPSGAPVHDVVVANLVASLITDLAVSLMAEVRPGGDVIASGIFVDREQGVTDALRTAGLRIGQRWREGDWLAIHAVKPA
jgi:ribosomal protein L11 methyltransferase